MRKKTISEIEIITGGGSPGCDFAAGAFAGWGLASVILGAASGGVALAVAGLIVTVYCAR